MSFPSDEAPIIEGQLGVTAPHEQDSAVVNTVSDNPENTTEPTTQPQVLDFTEPAPDAADPTTESWATGIRPDAASEPVQAAETPPDAVAAADTSLVEPDAQSEAVVEKEIETAVELPTLASVPFMEDAATASLPNQESITEETLAQSSEAEITEAHNETTPIVAVLVDVLPETSLNEEVDEQAEAEAAKEEEFGSLGRKDLIIRLKNIAQNDRISDPLVRKIKAAFDDQFELERTAALAAFLQEGGITEDFEFRKDPEAIEFEQLFRLVREKRKHQLDEIDKTKRINLKQKQQLIEDLKALNEQQESNGSLDEIRRIMDKWRSTGQVPHSDAQELFKNFDFQVDKFYSRRTEFFEMKELDRKRNLERKLALLERAKKTLGEPVFVKGLREYNKLYEEFRHTGPAPKEENERLYQEIKAIGAQLYEHKKTYDEAQHIEAERIAGLRVGLLTQMEVVSAVLSDTIPEWQTQTDLVQKLIGEWKAAGARVRDQDPEISKKFWAGLKKFYAAKEAYFKKLDKDRAENLAQKREILAKVQELAASENKFKVQAEINQLVVTWKEVGPVAFKDRDKINKEFSKALDAFYEAKRSTVSAEQTEQRDNLAKKQALIDKLLALAADKKGDEAELKEIQQEFNAAGFVPFKKKDEVNAAFKEAYTKAVEQSAEINQGQKAYVKLDALRSGGGRGKSFGPPIRKEAMGQRGVLNKRITGLEADVRNYKNNMDFIASTKNGEKLKAEFNERIGKAEEEINLLRQQLKDVEKAEPKA